MATKIKTIALEYPISDPNDFMTPNYLVARVTDSVTFTPGEILSKAEVERLCDSHNWKVTIVPRRVA